MPFRLIALLTAVSIACAGSVFASTPSKGEFNNDCAWGLTLGKQVKTDCSINYTDKTSGKTYCFSALQAKQEFMKDPASNAKKAAKRFKKMSKGGDQVASNTKKPAKDKKNKE